MSLPRPTTLEDTRQAPVSIQDLKDQLRIEHDDENRLMLLKIMAATNEAETFLGSAIIARSFDLVLDGFPACGIELSNPPVRSITSITYFDTDGVQQTFDSAKYSLHQQGPYPTVRLVPDESWPSTQSREDAVTVTYVAGHAESPAFVPAQIREAVILRAATRHAMSEEQGVGNVSWEISENLAFEALLRPYRVMRL